MAQIALRTIAKNRTEIMYSMTRADHVTSDKGAISSIFHFFLVRVRNRSWLLETTDEMTDLNVIFSIRIDLIGKAVI
jgi:hypothetical protein